MASGGDKVPLTVYLAPEDKAKLDQIAKENDRTASAEARRILRAALQERQGE